MKKIITIALCLSSLFANAQNCRKDTVTNYTVNASNVKTPYYRTINTFNNNNDVLTAIGQNYTDGQWVNYNETSITYNTAKNITNRTVKIWSNNAWVNFSKTDIDFNNAGDEVENNSYSWNNANNTWVPTSSKLTEYNGTGHVVIVTNRTGNLNTWVFVSRTNYVRDNAGNALETENLKWNTGTSAWDKLNKTIRTFNANNKFLTLEFSNWNGSTYASTTKETYTYNANNDEASYLRQNWTGATWQDQNRMFTTYNAANQVVRLNVQVYTGPQDGWKSINASNFTYNANGKLLQRINSSFTIPAQVETPTDKYEYTYNTGGLQTQGSSFDFVQNSFRENARVTTSYTSSNQVALEVTLYYNANVMNLVPFQKVENEYNVNNDLIGFSTFTNFSINTGGFQTIVREEYGCGIYANNTSVAKVNNSMHLVYPNPATNQLFVKSNENSSIVMLNTMGEQVLTCKMDAGIFEINTSELANGIYLLKISNNQESQLHKIIVSK